MQSIIVQSGNDAHANPGRAARQRADRLAKATHEQIETALAYLSMIDPEAFEIAFTAVTTASDEAQEEEGPIPLCRRCGAMTGIFPDHGLQWRHFHGDATTSGAKEIYDPGHAAQVTWILPDEGPEELQPIPSSARRSPPTSRASRLARYRRPCRPKSRALAPDTPWSGRRELARARSGRPPGGSE